MFKQNKFTVHMFMKPVYSTDVHTDYIWVEPSPQAKPHYAKPTAQCGTSCTYSFLCAGCALLRIMLQPANHYTQPVPARAEKA